MKSLLVFVALPILTLPLQAQDSVESPQAGFLNLVNLITLKSPTFVDLAGFKLNGGEAMAPGDTSGVLAIKPETYSFTLANAGAKPETITGSFTMEQGKTVAIICYDEVKENRDGKREVKLRYNLLIESDEQTGPRLSIVSLLNEPLVGIEVSGVPVTLTERLAHQAKVSLNEEVTIVHKGRTLAGFEVTKPVHTILFLFENPETGEVEISMIQNEKLEYHPPLDGEDEDEEEEN